MDFALAEALAGVQSSEQLLETAAAPFDRQELSWRSRVEHSLIQAFLAVQLVGCLNSLLEVFASNAAIVADVAVFELSAFALKSSCFLCHLAGAGKLAAAWRLFP